MGSRIIQDSDDDSDGSIEPNMAAIESASTTVDAAKPSFGESSFSLDTVTSENGYEPFAYQLWDDNRSENQKRKLEPSHADEDEISLIPERKRLRSKIVRHDLGEIQDAADRASMPPPASPNSVGLQNHRAVSLGPYGNSSICTQPSPPRLYDDLSFTTDGSMNQRGSQSGSALMFPGLDPLGFQERLVDIDIDHHHTKAGVTTTLQQEDTGVVEHQKLHQPGSVIDLTGYAEGPKSKAFLRIEVPIRQEEEASTRSGRSPSPRVAPKKKRGRPRKTEVDEDREENTGEGNSDAVNGMAAVEAGSGNARGRKRAEPSVSAAEVGTSAGELLGDSRKLQTNRNHSKDRMPPDPLAEAVEDTSTAEYNNGPHTPSPKRAAVVEDLKAEVSAANQPKPKAKQHSPISSSKVPLRVGLSKRARIEPLLKVVRK